MTNKLLSVKEAMSHVITEGGAAISYSASTGENDLANKITFSERLKTLISAVRREQDEMALKVINGLSENNPYAPDVFKEKSEVEWKKFHVALAKDGILGDGYLGSVARLAYENALKDLKKKILEEK